MPGRLDTQLLFGERDCESFVSAQAYADHVARFNPALAAVDPAPGRPGLQVKSAFLRLPTLQLWHTVASPLRIRFGTSGEPVVVLMIPLGGSMRARVGRRSLSWGRGSGGLYLPETSDLLETSASGANYLAMGLDLGQMRRAADAVFGRPDGRSVDLQLGDARLLPSDTGGGLPVDAMVRQLGRLAEVYGQDPQFLHHAGLDDFIHRQLVPLFRPDWRRLVDGGASRPRHSKQQAVDRLCDIMRADLSRRFTLTDLATMGHMSVRSLQYAFRRRFDMSAMGWLREQRLDAAHRCLRGRDVDKIESLARACGFGTASHFVQQYRQRFGETPGATLARSGATRAEPAWREDA